jgi:gag-polypeptide of LTR copia-type/Retrotransposon gag protein
MVMTDVISNLRLTTIPLNETNYEIWSRAITKSLKGRGKIGYIDGTKIKPTGENTEATGEEWEICDNQVSTWILNSIESNLSSQFIYTNTALELWTEIKSRFCQETNFVRIFQLKQQLSQLKQENLSISKYVGRLKIKNEKLASYQPPSNDPRKIIERAEIEKVYQFLTGLDPSYEPIRA